MRNGDGCLAAVVLLISLDTEIVRGEFQRLEVTAIGMIGR